jgi:hypothetical protein
VYLGRRRRWVVVEVQNKIDPKKRRRWLLAASLLFNAHGQMGDVLVITASRHVARWAADVASARSKLGTQLTLRPVVLLLAGAAVEALLDPRQPELAFFAAWAMQERHGRAAKQTVRRAIELTGKLPAPLREQQARAILNVLNEEMAPFFDEVMMETSKQGATPWARAVLAKIEARGREKGKADGKQEALLAVLTSRELPVSATQEKRIKKCTDLDVLDLWIRRATTASSVKDVLGPAARSPQQPAAKPARAAARRRASRA